MNEIKFRAWDKQDKEMIHDIQDCYDDEKGSCFGQFISPYYFNGTERYEVMQFTGILDIEKKEIFAGDICYSPNGIGVVKAFPGMFGFEVGEAKGQSAYIFAFHNWRDSYKVLGNIYENSELLEVK